MRVPLSSTPDAAQMYVESGLAEVSPAPPVAPVAAGADVGAAVAGAEVTAGTAVAAGTVTMTVVAPHPATARTDASPNTHDAMR